MQKNELINYRSTIRGKDSKGRDRYQFYLDQQEIPKVIEELTKSLDNERGAKLTFHVETKITDTGTKFDSTFGFVSIVGQNNGPVKTTVVKKEGPSLEEKIKALKEKQAG